MFRPLEFFVGLRYTRAKRRNHFISFISGISMLGITLGVMALITVLSVMNGFQNEVRERILGMTSHVNISGSDGSLTGWPGVAERAKEHPRVIGAAPYIRGEGMLSHGRYVQGTLVNGVLPRLQPQVSIVGDNMVAGSMDALQPGEYNIVLGRDLARALGVQVGDRVVLVTPNASVGPTGFLPRLKRFRVGGIFQVGMYEYDSGLALIHMDDAARLYRKGDSVSGVRLRLDDMFTAPRVARQLGGAFGGDYWISDWTYRHANFFRALKIEKTALFIILLLIVAVAAFNIVSTLVMVVTDKQSDIAILRTLGASPGSILGIFMVQGTVIGLIGTALGVVTGVALALNIDVIVPFIERSFDVEFLPSSVYYISELPSDLRWNEVFMIASVSFGLSILATLYPAWRASRTQPAEALRYE
jgi:lipoprotein-releasing system permease protein